MKTINKDVAKLRAEMYRMSFYDQSEWFIWLDKVARPEFLRIYNLDKSMKELSAENVCGMLRMNISHRFVPLHEFGLFCKY